MHSDTARELLQTTGTTVVDRGDGAVVALAHGAGGGVMENFAPLFEALTPRRRLISPYWPGAGGTPRRVEPLQLDELADLVVAAAVAGGADRFPVVGISLGAAVAVTAAVRHPDHVSGLVLTAGLAVADTQVRLAVDAWRALDAADEMDALSALLLNVCASSRTLTTMSREEERAARADIARTYPAGSADHAELVARVDVADLLARIEVPALVVVSGDDRLVLPATARRFADGIAGAESVIYDDAGHIFTPQENARWAADVEGFLDRTS